MSTKTFYTSLTAEIARIDKAGVTKRNEFLIEGFTPDASPQAIIGENSYRIFNSNDYLGLRHHPLLKEAEHKASSKLGTGPGAVRFISGSFAIHRQLEEALASFHGRDDAIVFSSAFAANLAVLFSLIKGQNKDSLVNGDTLVISDELNHRSIIDGIRLANLPSEQKLIFAHLDISALEKTLQENASKYNRVVVVTDGVFSMVGEYQNLKELRRVVDACDSLYEGGILLVVDDCHGVASCGQTGRGTEEMTGGTADVLVGTFGKGFGSDGGYVVADQVVIDYLRESAATYIYSNSITPGTASAALAAVKLVSSAEGARLLQSLSQNVALLKDALATAGFTMVAESTHPIQPLLIGDPQKTKALKQAMFEAGFLITNINYPVVARGRDEIRIQLSATHTADDISLFVSALIKASRKLAIL
jgi:glycine C-acetyltransferase